MAATNNAGTSGQSRSVRPISSGDGEYVAVRIYTAEGGEDAYARFY